MFLTTLSASLLLTGCIQDKFLTLSGKTFSDDSEAVISDAQVTTYDFGMMETDSVTTGSDGSFEASVRAGGIFYMELSASGHTTTGIAGSVGQTDFELGDGLAWLRSDEELAVVRADFAGCPGASGDGAVIEGEIRLAVSGQSVDEALLSYTGWAMALDADGNEYPACYLADDELVVAYDSEAIQTGYHGRFAIFDAPTGPISIAVGYYIDGLPYYENYYYLYVPEGGVTPLYPAWVELI